MCNMELIKYIIPLFLFQVIMLDKSSQYEGAG